MLDNGDKSVKIRLRFPGGEEFEAEGNRDFVEEQRNYFLSLIGKKEKRVSFAAPQPVRAFAKEPAPLPVLSPLPPAQRPPTPSVPAAPTNIPTASNTATGEAFPALRLWERLLKEDGEIVVLRKKMRLTAQEAALLLLAGARVLLKKPSYAALHLSKSMRKSGYSEGRLDRLLLQDIKNGHLTSDGSKRSRSYRLTNEGFAKAYVMAEKLGAESL